MYDPIKNLSDEQLGQLFRLIFETRLNPRMQINPEINPMVLMAFRFFENQFRLDDVKYSQFVERQRENGKKGGRPKQEKPNNPLVSEETQKTQPFFSKPKKAYKEKDKVKDKDKDKDKDIYISTSPEVEDGNLSVGFKTLGSFEKRKDEVVMKVSELYPDKLVDKAFDNFVEQNKIKSYKYKNYYLAFCNWVREDRYGKYSKQGIKKPSPFLKYAERSSK